MKLEDTLTDMNYSLIDIINYNQERKEKITYIEFEESGYRIIWDYPELYDDEVLNVDYYLNRAFEELDLVTLSLLEIKALKDYYEKTKKESLEIYLITELSESYKTLIENFLHNKGIDKYIDDIIYSIDEDNICEYLLYNDIEIYIEDNPYLIKEVSNLEEVVIIVRSHSYNESCYNLLRLDCYSQLDSLIKRAEKKLEKIKNKSKKK